MANAYFQFLINSYDLDINGKSSRHVDSTSTLLLNEIALHHFKRKPLTVSQAMDMSFIAGPATIHRKIKELQKDGLVELRYSGLNRRTKYLIPTDTANSHFKKMSEAMKNACSN